MPAPRLLPLCLLSLLVCILAPRLYALAVEEATVADLQAAYRSGELTVRQVVTAYLARIEAYDKQGPYLNSLISLNPRALEEADRLDAALAAGKTVGPLHGIPVIVKDCIDVTGMPMTAGFQGWKNYMPPTDAPLIARIKAAGGIILAKSSLSEFTKGGADNINSVLGGFARNPYHTAYATGGSSGGTGASIAANFGTLGIGSDTMGSIRNPSSFNALVGLRTTVGLVPRLGMTPNSSLRDTVGPMCRTVTDLARLLDVMAGPDPADAVSQKSTGHIPPTYTAFLKKDGLAGVRLGVLRQAFAKGADPRILAEFEKVLAELKAAGAELVDPFTVAEFETLPRPPQTAARFKDDMTKFLVLHPGIPYPSVAAIAGAKLVHPLHQPFWDEAAAALPVEQDPATIKGMQDEDHWREVFTQAFAAARIAAVVMPNNAQPPVINGDRNTQKVTEPKPGGGASAASSTTFIGSALQWPAIVVPAGFVKGLPISLQFLGRPWEEANLIQYAYAYEQATQHRRPPTTVPPLGD